MLISNDQSQRRLTNSLLNDSYHQGNLLMQSKKKQHSLLFIDNSQQELNDEAMAICKQMGIDP